MLSSFAPAIAFLLLPAVAAPVSAAAAPSTSSASPAFGSLAGCLGSRRHLLLAFVIDESASLGDASQGRAGSDPTGERVTAAQVAVQSLTNLAGRGTGVDVLLAGFSDTLHPYGGWQTLNAASSSSIVGQLDGFRTRDQGLDTDFYNAMAGVQHELASRAAALPAPSCQAVLLFTDGRFDIDSVAPKPYDANGADPKQVKAQKGIAALCASGGPMQRLRDGGAVTFTLALGNPSAPITAQPDRAFLERLANGNCAVAGAQYGASFDAASASDIVNRFDSVASGIRGGTQRLGDCVGNANAFSVVAALGGFHVLVDNGSGSRGIVLTTPSHQQVAVSPAGAVSNVPAGLTVRAAVTGRFVAIDASPAPRADPASSTWSGAWSVNFAGATRGGSCQVSLFDAWKPVLQASALQPGRTSLLVVGIVDAAGKPARLDQLQVNHGVIAVITTPGSHAAPTTLSLAPSGDRYVGRFAVPRDLAGKTVTIAPAFHVTVGGADVVSAPAPVELRVGGGAGVARGPASPPVTVRGALTATSKPSGLASKLLAVVGLVAVALLLALLLVRRARGRAPTFVAPSRLRAARIPVRVRRNGTLSRLTDGGGELPLTLRDNDFVACRVAAGALSSFTWGDLRFEAVARRRLLARGHGVVTTPGRYLTASGGTLLGGGHTIGRLPLRLAGTWVYQLEALDEDETNESPVDGYVTVFVSADQPVAPQAQKVVDSLNSFFADIVLGLARQSPAPASSRTS